MHAAMRVTSPQPAAYFPWLLVPSSDTFTTSSLTSRNACVAELIVYSWTVLMMYPKIASAQNENGIKSARPAVVCARESGNSKLVNSIK